MLEDLSGLDVMQPHPSDAARRFFQHLSDFAPGDLDGLLTIVSAVLARPTRKQLLESAAEHWTELSTSELATDVAGYVARAREWGLIAPQQVDGRYMETGLAQELPSEFAD